MKTCTRRAIAIATTALMLLGMPACSNDRDNPGKSTGPLSSEPASSTATSAADVASAAAISTAKHYYAVLDQVRQQPGAPLARLNAVATSVELSSLQSLIKRERSRGQHQVGDVRLIKTEVASVNLQAQDAGTRPQPLVQVDICWDVSAVDVVDTKGKSVVAPSRPNKGWSRLTVVELRSSAEGDGWRVASSQDLEKKPCAAA